jgi:hypothetical protein
MKKVKILQALAIVVFMIALSVACNKDEEISMGFDIVVPDNWVHYTLASQGLVYSAERNAVNVKDSIREYLQVYREPLSGYTLNTYYAALKANILSSDYYVSTIAEKDTTINGADSKKLICNEIGFYITSQNDTSEVNLITTRYMFLESNYGYHFGFVAVDTTYYRTKPVFDDIISSLQFTN